MKPGYVIQYFIICEATAQLLCQKRLELSSNLWALKAKSMNHKFTRDEVRLPGSVLKREEVKFPHMALDRDLSFSDKEDSGPSPVVDNQL